MLCTHEKPTSFPLSLAAGFDSVANQASFGGVGKCEDAYLAQHSNIKHARHFGRAPALAGATAARLVERVGEPKLRTGLICNGGPWNLHASWSFLSRARDAGPAYLNPIHFAPTLVSATATAVAAAVGAHAFSYVVGCDYFAFFDVLGRATQALRHGYAERVFALAVSASDSSIEAAVTRAGLLMPIDVGLGFSVGGLGTGDLSLLEVVTEESSIANYSLTSRYDALIDGSRLTFPCKTPISGTEALGATAAVLILSAAEYHSRHRESSEGPEFIVTLRNSKRFAAAILRINLS
jgi:hypothetical protein